jgi:glutamate racemase
MSLKVRKVGVFDSGVGGITVLSELRKSFPALDYVYFGDTAHVPYGGKSPAQIEKLSIDCVRVLKEKNVDLLVVACNTAASWALPAIRSVMGQTPVVGVVEPGVDAAMSALGPFLSREAHPPILVLATRATVRSHAYGNALTTRLLNGVVSKPVIIEQACPLLVPMIEEGWIDHPILHQTISEYVQSYFKSYPPGIALLGCTHYPWIHSAFEKALPGWLVVNSAWAVAEKLKEFPGFLDHPSSDQDRSDDNESNNKASSSNDTGSNKNRSSENSTSEKEDQASSGYGHVEWIFTDSEAVPQFAKKLIT